MTKRYKLRKIYEKWKDIPSYEGLYQVSNLGRIRNKHNKILKLRKVFDYELIGLMKDGKRTSIRVHRAVKASFDPIDGFDLKRNDNHSNIQIDHINGIKNDNRLRNLNYVTHSENNKKRPHNIICSYNGIIYNSVRECIRLNKVKCSNPNIKRA